MIQVVQLTKIFPVGALLAFLAFATLAQAVSPPPDGGYPGGNTAEGKSALFRLTTGGFNTALGFFSLGSDTTGQFNTGVGAGALLANTADEITAVGAGALLSNTTGVQNTANGAFAPFSNTTGSGNTANGYQALTQNTVGQYNAAIGDDALYNNTTGSFNTATGTGALALNTTGTENTATGENALANNTIGNNDTANGIGALHDNTTGLFNTAIGSAALRFNTTGNNNTANGVSALFSNATGSNNIALGAYAGQNLTTGDYNIDIGNDGVAEEANTIRIGDDNHHGAVYVAGIYNRAVAGLAVVMDSSDHLGTAGSWRRFKDDIEPMGQASEAILALKPVTFRYKKEIDPAGASQFGLVAEEVEKANPDLVVRDKEGRPYSVRYDAVNAMLLNEFLKEHHTVQELQSNAAKQEGIMAQQQKQIEALIAGLQKVSAQLELSRTAPQTVAENQ
jgi:trimeric autotransporter adhesin